MHLYQHISKKLIANRIRLAYNDIMINKKIQYILERVIYSIDNLSKGQLLITVEDLQAKTKSTLKLGDSQLLNYKIDTERLNQMVYFQHIYDNKLPKRMLELNGNHIIFHFDYPKAQIKSLQFSCQTVSNESPVIQRTSIEQLDKYRSNQIEKIFENYISKIQELIASKLQQADKRLESKLMQFNNKLQMDSEQTIQSIAAFYRTTQQEHNRKFNGYLTSTMQKIQEINQRILREHLLTFQKLEDKVIILNDNVKEFYDKLNDLTTVIDNHKTQQEDDVRNLNISIKEKTAEMRWNIKEIKENLSARLDWIIKLNNLKEEQPTVSQDMEEGYILNQKNLFQDLDFLAKSRMFIILCKKLKTKDNSRPIEPATNSI